MLQASRLTAMAPIHTVSHLWGGFRLPRPFSSHVMVAVPLSTSTNILFGVSGSSPSGLLTDILFILQFCRPKVAHEILAGLLTHVKAEKKLRSFSPQSLQSLILLNKTRCPRKHKLSWRKCQKNQLLDGLMSLCLCWIILPVPIGLCWFLYHIPNSYRSTHISTYIHFKGNIFLCNFFFYKDTAKRKTIML